MACFGIASIKLGFFTCRAIPLSRFLGPKTLFPAVWRSNFGKVVNKLLNWTAAVLLAAAFAVSQMLLGGWWYPALAAPGYLLAGLAAVAAGFAFTGARDAPGAWCFGSAAMFSCYLLWRQSDSLDAYAAQADRWLLLGALGVYLAAAWQLRAKGPRALLLAVLFFFVVAQSLLAIAQFAAQMPFHPWPDLARHMALPRGDAIGWRAGWLSGTFASRTALAGALEVTTFLSLGLLVWGRGGAAIKLLLLWTTAAGFVGLSLSLSRSAYLGVPAGVAVFALLSFFLVRRGAVVHRGWLMAGTLLLVALSLALGLAAGAESFAVRMRLTELRLDEYREKLWFFTVPPMLGIDPWFGAGANMFDQLSLRYRGIGFTAKPVHAHNDWLQLLIEYGRIGLLLGFVFFAVHVIAGWRNALRLVREAPAEGVIPQSLTLGLCTGSVAAVVAVGVHALFDYSLHLPAVALLVGLCGGWLAGTRVDAAADGTKRMPWWLRILAISPLVPGIVLVMSVIRHGPAELHALRAENELISGSPRVAQEEAQAGLRLQPGNARLLVLAGESAGQLGDAEKSREGKMSWYRRAAGNLGKAAGQRPYFSYAWRERALALDCLGLYGQALPSHLRAVARDPDHARAYEYLAVHFWRQGRTDEALRLFRVARTLPGSRLSAGYIEAIEKGRESF